MSTKRGRHSGRHKQTKSSDDDTCGSASLDIDDLHNILDQLKTFSMRNWRQFGLNAGLCNTTLDNIEVNKTVVEDRFMECLSCWLRREDKVDKHGKPSWSRLAEILEKIGERALKSKIEARIRGIKELSSEISSRDPSETPQSCISDTETFNDDDKEYTEMQQQLSQVLTFMMPLADIEMQLASWLAIKKFNEGFNLMSLLKSYFSLSNLAALKDFVQHCRINDSARRKLNKLLQSLSLRRNRFYEKTLAKDFAKEDHKMFDSSINLIITFKVSWNEDETTLKDFDDFLSADFKNNGKYIRLRVVHQRGQSPLKFECSIPNCLKEEIKECVTKKKDQLILEGVVEVTIDNAVIFNVEGGYAAVIYYEPNDMMKFTAVHSIQLPALLKCINECCPYFEVGLIHYFHFESSGPIELIFYQKAPTGWIIKPKDTQSQQLMQADIDKFNGTVFSLHPCCPVLVCGSCDPNTEQSLYFPITLSGIKCGPVTLYIHRTLESIIPKITPYTGLIYCEKKEDNTYVLGFVAAIETNFKSIIDYNKDCHCIMKLVNFDFDQNSNDIIKLKLRETSFSNWIAKPQSYELSKNEVDKATHNPPSCVISICRPLDAAQPVQYSLSLEGLTDPVTIDFKLYQTLHDINSYIGLVYYEWKKSEYLMTFVAGKKLSKLIQYIKNYNELAEISDVFTFSFGSPHGFIELKFDDKQCKGKGWTVQPLVVPCRLYQDVIDEATYPVPPSCYISIYPSPDAVPSLHYSVPLEGVAEPVTLFIRRKLQQEKLIASTAAMQKLHESLEKQKMLPEELKLELQGTKVGDWHSVVGNYIMEKNKENEEEKRRLEEQYLKEKQITKELKTKVADNELYVDKLIKEREQWRSQTKETSSVGVQFNYLIPSMDNLDCLSDIQVAEKKLFLIQGDKPQLMNWERYGVRIGVQEDTLLPTETVEAAVVALVGGEFQFPPNTVLVSAVYAVSLSKPLLKRLILEIQHCVDLTRRPGLSHYLKFAIAPINTHSVPYQFSIVEGGQFSPYSGYGSIERKEFCLVCILGEEWTNGGGSDVPIASVNNDEGDTEVEEKEEDHLSVSAQPLQSPIDVYTPSTCISECMNYVIIRHYEYRGVENLVKFTAAKDLNALVEFIYQNYSQAEIGQSVYFRFQPSSDCVELKLDTPQEKSFAGWTIQPHYETCKLHRFDIDKFGGVNNYYSIPSSCPISVCESPDAVPSLHYSVPLEGVADPVTIYIHASRRTIYPPSTDPTSSSSSSNVVHESTSVSSTGGATTVDVNKVKKVINDVVVSRYADFNSLPKGGLSVLANQLYTVRMINNAVRQAPSMEMFITEFKASLRFKRKLPQVQEHCQKFLSSFIAVRGSYADTAIALGEDWIEAIRNELGFDFNINLDA